MKSIKRLVIYIPIIFLIIVSFSFTSVKNTEEYNFTHTYINNNLPTIDRNGVQTLADYDNDGDLDMTIGSLGYGVYLMKNNGSNWTTSRIGNLPYTALGAEAIDVNSDGWVDLIAAGVWYENNFGTSFTMHTYDSKFKSGDHFHDIVAADINNDGKKDIVGMGDDIGFFWYELWSNPEGMWSRTKIDPTYPDWNDHVHGGFSSAGIGDIDGDGDNDIFRANAWFENQNDGATWIKHPVIFSELFTGKLPYGKSTRSVVIDIDHDGDNDIVFTTCDDVDGKAGIMENTLGNGSEWALKLFPQTASGRRGSLHSIQVADMNGDGKLEVITADQEDMIEAGMPSPRWYVYYQTDSGWEEQVLFDMGLGSHELFAKDADQDGDLDLVGKNWYPWSGNATYGTSHADYFENHQIDQNHTALRMSTNVNTAWTQTGGKWEQLGDLIIGGQDLSGMNSGGLLLSKQKFGDCEIVCDVWPDYGADSGIFLRTDDEGKKAYQVTIDYQENNPMGGIYLSGMDASANWDFTIKNENEIDGNPQFFDKNAWSYIWKENDWNQFRIRIENNPPTITTWINGFKVNEYTDSHTRLPDEGKIGLQVHTGNDWIEGGVVRFKNIKVYPLTEPVKEIIKDTITKINFTYTGIHEEGWANVEGSQGFPISLNEGINISASGSTLNPGNQGETTTSFPTNVSSTFGYITDSDNDPAQITITGLNPVKKYAFDIFSSVKDTSANSNSRTYYAIGSDTVSVNPAGNTDSVVTISGVTPTEASEITLSISKEANQKGYINALIFSRIIEKMYSLTVETSGNGSISQGSGSFEEGTIVNVTATADDGWMFEKWMGDINSTNPTIEVEINADKYLIASFSPLPDPNVIAKINFTWDYTWDVPGWTSVYGSSSLPVSLGNGISITASGGNLAMGISGEPTSSIVPDKVSNTYNWLSNNDNTPVDIILTGLDPDKEYKFSIYASRDDNTASGDRTTTYNIVGTDKTVSINPIGNTDNLLVIRNVSPASTGTVILQISKLNGQYGYINGLIISKDFPTSSKNIEDIGKIKYYPVPVKNNLYIENLPQYCMISSYDIFGRKVFEKNTDETYLNVDMNKLNSGIYIFNVISDNKAKESFRVVKE